MSVELSLLKCMCDSKDIHGQYYPYISGLKNMDRDITVLYRTVDGYYDQYDSKTITESDLIAYYNYLYPSAKNRTLHLELIGAMFDMDVNHDIAKDELEKVMEKHYAAKIVSTVQPVLEGHRWGVLHEVEDLAREFVNKMRYPPAEAQALTPKELSLEELVQREIYPEGPDWCLEELNTNIGPLRLGKFGLAYAYVDTGKSSFGARCAAHWLKQMKDDEILIYAGNEEGISALQLRLFNALLDKDKYWIAENLDEAREAVAPWTTRLKMFDSIYHVKNVEDLLNDYRPRVMVIDQVTKLKSGQRLREGVEELGYVANFCRDKAKEFDTSIFGLAQATGESHDKKWINLTDMHYSRVGIQAELDYAIGIGADKKDAANDNRRYFNVSKNKFGDHVQFMAYFDPGPNIWTGV